jgi:hypothetical protein
LNWHLSDVIAEQYGTSGFGGGLAGFADMNWTGPPSVPREPTPSANVEGVLANVDAALGLLRRLMAGSAEAVDGGTRAGV